MQEDLDLVTGGAVSHCPRGYVQFALRLELGVLGLLLSSAPDEPICQLRLTSVAAGFTLRPAEAGG
ncbi:MAG: hypothetical protein SGPRY_001637 [Prymnesium sp.]